MDKTLIIHPQDDSTMFLNPIYHGVTNKFVLSERLNDRKEIKNKILQHDRIMIMGHGSPFGLFSVGHSEDTFLIDYSHAPLLKEKKNNVLIWCHADKYVEKNNLKGFYTGMFISEVMEAELYNLKGVTQKMIDESNNCFSKIIGETINKLPEEMYKEITQGEYKRLSAHNIVAEYNIQRLYLK